MWPIQRMPWPSISIPNPLKLKLWSDNEWYPEWKQPFATLWTNFDSHFAYLLARLERHTILVDNEAAAANLNEAHGFRIAARREFEEATRERHRRMLDDTKGWLSPLSFEDDIQRCQDMTDLCPNTGNWLFNDPRFSTWLHEDQEPILWLSGIPGSGESLPHRLPKFFLYAYKNMTQAKQLSLTLRGTT